MSSHIVSVLVVDDDMILRRIHAQLMKMVDLEVEIQTAENGQIAVEKCRFEKYFDIIFMDMEMPIKNGIETTKEIREMGIESLIVGVTAVTAGSEFEAFNAAGLNVCFEKPLTVDKIKSIIPNLNKN